MIQILSKYIGILGLQQIGPPICAPTLKLFPIMKVFQKRIQMLQKTLWLQFLKTLVCFYSNLVIDLILCMQCFIFFQQPNCGLPIEMCRNMPFQILMVNCTWSWILNWGFNFIQLNLVNVLVQRETQLSMCLKAQIVKGLQWCQKIQLPT